MPDGAAREPVDHLHAHLGGGPGGVHHLLSRSFTDPFRVPVAPDVVWQNDFVPFVDQITNRLASQVVGNSPALQPILGKQGMPAFAVTWLMEGLLNVEMIAPAG